MPALHLALHFVNREVRSRYLGSFSGALWALLQPLIQLGVYSFVWVYVFKMQRGAGTDGASIVPFLALGLWPWNVLAESLVRSSTAIQDNSALIGKVALPREILVFSCVAASFLLHGIGFIAIVSVLYFFGTAIHLAALPLALLLWVQLFVLTLGLAFIFSSVQVFVRDLSQVLAQILPLWMFLSPVLYSRDFLPEHYRPILDWNPFTFYPESLRALLLSNGSIDFASQAVSTFLALAILAIGAVMFRRLSPHFEDFL
jgi:lipopolysaccharide transport system permease protein